MLMRGDVVSNIIDIRGVRTTTSLDIRGSTVIVWNPDDETILDIRTSRITGENLTSEMYSIKPSSLSQDPPEEGVQIGIRHDTDRDTKTLRTATIRRSRTTLWGFNPQKVSSPYLIWSLMMEELAPRNTWTLLSQEWP